MSQPMKGITCCADCAYYNMKKHHCTRASDEGKPTDHFYADCPLPTVTPEPVWVSVKDRLPPSHETVIVSINDDRGDNDYRYSDVGWYLPEGECWIVDDEAIIDVEAWMPLPKHYEPTKEDTLCQTN
ncbi:MAG: DUF551 domain-containing protein [Acidaminococcaceae bacterium]|nr:DUF551 domain-containing protein [Acidaminococcaceae bacterium]